MPRRTIDKVGSAVIALLAATAGAAAAQTTGGPQQFKPVIAAPTPIGGFAAGTPIGVDPNRIVISKGLASFVRCAAKAGYDASIRKTRPGSLEEADIFSHLLRNNLLCRQMASGYDISNLRNALELHSEMRDAESGSKPE